MAGPCVRPFLASGMAVKLHFMRPSGTALAIAALFVCAPLTAAREAPLPDVPLPGQFDHASPQLAAPMASDGWWKVFADPQLDALMARMHAGNTGIAQAAARLDAARAQARLGKASQLPELGLTASASHAGGPLVNEAGTSGSLFTARATISWEADLLGKLSSERSAERLEAKAAEALLADTRLLMEAETAHAFFQARYLGLACAEARRQVALFNEAAAISANRLNLGLIDRASANRAIQQRDAARRTAADLALERDDTLRRIAFLLGDTTSPGLDMNDLPDAPMVPAGLPADMLARRPDVAAAIARVEASDNRLRAARKSWLPSFSLTASGGAASPSLGQILASSARDFGLSALLSLPIFDGGRRKAAIGGRRAELDLAAAQYRESVLASVREVNDTLGAVQASVLGLDLARDRLALGEANRAIAASRAANGLSSRSSALEAELAVSDLRLQALAAHHARIAASIGLIEALGGGW